MISNDDALLPRIDSREAVAACLREPSKHGGKIVTLTGGELLRETEVVSIISKEAKKKVRYCKDPTPLKSFLQKEKLEDLGHGVTMWDLQQQIWAVERHWITQDKGQPSPRLQPQTFEELTGCRYRSLADFTKEHAPVWRKTTMVSLIIRLIAATNPKCRDPARPSTSCFRPSITDVAAPGPQPLSR